MAALDELPRPPGERYAVLVGFYLFGYAASAKRGDTSPRGRAISRASRGFLELRGEPQGTNR